MKRPIIILASALCLLCQPCFAQSREIEDLKRLQLNEHQVESLFSLFLGHIPSLINESTNGEQLMRELAPQALDILNRDQKRALSRLDPEEKIQRFSSMTREEKTKYMFDNARALVHPSKKEVLDKMEEIVELELDS